MNRRAFLLGALVTGGAMKALTGHDATTAWLTADEWEGEVFIDSRDVSNDCNAVLVDGERPIAARLYRVNEIGQHYIDGLTGDVAVETVLGDIRIRLRHRRRA